MKAAARLLPQIKVRIPLLSSQRFAPFSSSPGAVNPRFSNSFFDEDEGSSAVYRHALKFQRPSIIQWRKQFCNSASFIGTLIKPVKVLSFENGELWAYTLLSVSTSPQSKGTIRILLNMRNEMAEICCKHLKEKDFVYVSGHLGSYTEADENGNLILRYKVTVKELNYVTRRFDSICRKFDGPQSGESALRRCDPVHQNFDEPQSGEGETALDKYRNRLHLWQVLFTNPYEWWDNRESKVNPRSPDFKHKDTGEALWVRPNDPPWVKKQVKLLDAYMAKGQGERIGYKARASKWEFHA